MSCLCHCSLITVTQIGKILQDIETLLVSQLVSQLVFGDDKLKVKEVAKILTRKFDKFINSKATVHGLSHETKTSAAQSEHLADDVNSDDIVNISD